MVVDDVIKKCCFVITAEVVFASSVVCSTWYEGVVVKVFMFFFLL
jgi:hypothetical protein